MSRILLACLTVLWVLLPKSCEAKNLLAFRGQINTLQKEIFATLHFENGSVISTQLISAAKDNFRFNVKIDHLKTPFFDLSTTLDSSVEVGRENNGVFRILHGNIQSQYSLLNYKPAQEFSGSFEIREGRLYFSSLSWGEMSSSGYIGLFSPHEMDLTLNIADMSVKNIELLLGCPASSLKGTVSAQMRLLGFFDRLVLRGKLIASEGTLKDWAYDEISVNFEGRYPKVNIYDSTVTKADGLSFKIEGEFSLSEGCDLNEKLALLKLSPLVDENLSLREWTIKRRTTEGTSSATELKYLLRKETDRNASSREDKGLLGIERNIKF